MTTARRLSAWALALATSSLVTPAMAQATVTNVTTDAIALLDVDWTFVAADSGLLGVFVGTHWEAFLMPTFVAGSWQVDSWYRHLDGPHGEGAETAVQYLGQVSFIPGAGAVLGPVSHDHGPPDVHVAAHLGFLAANGPAPVDGGVPPGFAREVVAHVPEPAEWALMLGGLGLLALTGRRRRS